MKRFGFAIVGLLASQTLFAADARIEAAQRLAQRVVGARAKSIDFSIFPFPGYDGFTYEAANGKVHITGSTVGGLTRGFYAYLKNECKTNVTWDHPAPRVPETWPSAKSVTGQSPQRYRHYYNVCTFGYTTAFWDWKRWEREIDWMALHGVNMPLAMVGQEAAWQKVWREQGLTDAQIGEFFSGPAFLPWHRMGNLNGWCGPLPQSWIDGQAALQKKILGRMRELGMTPVTPAFSGFVPPAYAAKVDATRGGSSLFWRSSGWCGFEPTYLLNPRSAEFKSIGKRYVEVYREMFGSDHLYLADVFNEMTPQVNPATKLADLHDVGKAVYDSILAGDPDGVWVMQGWLFLNEASFWGEPEIEAFLGAVPNDRMVLLDLACEMTEIWRRSAAFRNKGWIFNVLHNFGQDTAQFGAPERYLDTWQKALKDQNAGQWVGMGMTPEGIEQNPLIYELLTDMMWTREPIAYGDWLHKYLEQRYGAANASAEQAFRLMPASPMPSNFGGGPILGRPNEDRGEEPGKAMDQARRQAQKACEALQANPTNDALHRDAVDAVKIYMNYGCSAALASYFLSDDKASQAQAKATFFQLVDDFDRLVGSRPEYRLERWIQMARKWGKTPGEKNLMERNARYQVTLWGGPILQDYACKEWAQLVSGFYKERWKLFFKLHEQGTANADIERALIAWETHWAESRAPLPRVRKLDLLAEAPKLFQTIASIHPPTVDKGIAVGKPTSDSGHTENGGSPSNANDGAVGGGYWAANPAPQWWQVDLERPTAVGRIQVIPYYGDGRYYQYKVEGSLDGTSWNLLVDESHNVDPATGKGKTHAVATTTRYVRVTMLFNSANVGVHLREVRLFGPTK